mgnify:CR=1 FL=1
MVLIEARDRPKNLKVTSLQLIVFCFNCFKRSSFDRLWLRFSAEQTVDSSIVILNEQLEHVLGDDITQADAFAAADNVLYNAVAGIAEIINVGGTVNVDFEDVKTVMSVQGKAMMGTATCNGDNRAKDAAERAVKSPLLEGVDLSGAKGILVNISASSSLKVKETKTVMEYIRSFAEQDANIIFGTVSDDNLGDELRVTVVATGLGLTQPQQLHSVIDNEEKLINEDENADLNLKTGTDGYSSSGLDEPDVWTNPKFDADARKKAAEKVKAMEDEGVESLDIPAFIRKQAD